MANIRMIKMMMKNQRDREEKMKILIAKKDIKWVYNIWIMFVI